MGRHAVATIPAAAFARARSALPQERPLDHYVVRSGSTVMSTKALHGKGNTPERKAKCKIKSRRHGVFKSSIRLHKTRVISSGFDADR